MALQATPTAVVVAVVAGVACVVGVIGRKIVAPRAGNAPMRPGPDVEPSIVVRAAPLVETMAAFTVGSGLHVNGHGGAPEIPIVAIDALAGRMHRPAT